MYIGMKINQWAKYGNTPVILQEWSKLQGICRKRQWSPTQNTHFPDCHCYRNLSGFETRKFLKNDTVWKPAHISRENLRHSCVSPRADPKSLMVHGLGLYMRLWTSFLSENHYNPFLRRSLQSSAIQCWNHSEHLPTTMTKGSLATKLSTLL